MRILAIDPGTTKSAFVIYKDDKVERFGILENEEMLEVVKRYDFPDYCDHLAIEMIACYGMPAGATLFETCVWIGRFIEHWGGVAYTKIYRKDVKMHLCHSMRANDSNIRQVIIDRYPATGGGKTPQVGIKSKPGPLFGISTDIWSALAVAITYTETKMSKVKSVGV